MKMKTELFDRYVREVGRRLPKKQRDDVKAELHSLLTDALQDRMPEWETEDEAALEAAQVAILEEFGPPAKVAAQYTPPHRYLIGPRIFDIYAIVVAAVAGSLSLVFLIILPLITMWGEAEPLMALGSCYIEVFDDYLGAALAGFGSVTLTFAILERVLPESIFGGKDEEPWDPRTLPKIEDRTHVQIGGLIAETVLIVIALTVFNFFPQWIGLNFVASVDDAPHRWFSIPLLASTFFTAYLPLLNLVWILNIGLNLVLLRQGKWQLFTRLFDFALTIFGAIICYRMLTGPAILSMDAITPESLRQLLDSILSLLLKVALIIGLISGIVEAARKLYRIVQTGSRRVRAE
ncbi:MAG: hypothetical protein JXA14_04025 [Anaerolineae bacterium]|nr:hypothetical protein [Anaerolineae bacterium]